MRLSGPEGRHTPNTVSESGSREVQCRTPDRCRPGLLIDGDTQPWDEESTKLERTMYLLCNISSVSVSGMVVSQRPSTLASNLSSILEAVGNRR